MSEDIIKQIKATLRLLEQEIPEDETIKRDAGDPLDNTPQNKAEDALQPAEVPATKNLKSILRRLKAEIDELENEVIASDIEEKVKRLRSLLRKGKEVDENYDEDVDVEVGEEGEEPKRLKASDSDISIRKKIEDLLRHKRLKDDESEEEVMTSEEDEEDLKGLKSSTDDIRKKINALLSKRLKDDESVEDEVPVEGEEEDEISDEEVKALKSLLRKVNRKKK
jgi:hypothetical protein